MSKKISLNIQGKVRPNLSSLFKKFITRKGEETQKKMAYYYRLFPFLTQWAIDEDDAEMILRYYGYLDRHGNICMNPKYNGKGKTGTDFWDEDFDDYEEIYPGPSDEDEEEDIYSELYPDEYWEELEKEREKKKGKKGKYKHSKCKGKKNKVNNEEIDITKPYSQGFIDEGGDGSVPQYIFFYPDYGDKTDRLEFNSLKDFDDFCSKNEFIVPPYVAERIAYRPVSHVCLNPGAKERGVDEIMGSESYADMYYEAGEELQIAYR